MDDMALVNIARNISIIASIVGLLAGLDLVLGAKITTTLKNILDRAMVNVDKVVLSVKARIALGVIFILISGLMIVFIMTVRA